MSLTRWSSLLWLLMSSSPAPRRAETNRGIPRKAAVRTPEANPHHCFSITAQLAQSWLSSRGRGHLLLGQLVLYGDQLSGLALLDGPPGTQPAQTGQRDHQTERRDPRHDREPRLVRRQHPGRCGHADRLAADHRGHHREYHRTADLVRGVEQPGREPLLVVRNPG